MRACVLREVANALLKMADLIEQRELTNYATCRRKFPDGYAFIFDGHPVQISCVMSARKPDGSIVLAYGLKLAGSGEPFDTIPEKRVPTNQPAV